MKGTYAICNITLRGKFKAINTEVFRVYSIENAIEIILELENRNQNSDEVETYIINLLKYCRETDQWEYFNYNKAILLLNKLDQHPLENFTHITKGKIDKYDSNQRRMIFKLLISLFGYRFDNFRVKSKMNGIIKKLTDEVENSSNMYLDNLEDYESIDELLVDEDEQIDISKDVANQPERNRFKHIFSTIIIVFLIWSALNSCIKHLMQSKPYSLDNSQIKSTEWYYSEKYKEEYEIYKQNYLKANIRLKQLNILVKEYQNYMKEFKDLYAEAIDSHKEDIHKKIMRIINHIKNLDERIKSYENNKSTKHVYFQVASALYYTNEAFKLYEKNYDNFDNEIIDKLNTNLNVSTEKIEIYYKEVEEKIGLQFTIKKCKMEKNKRDEQKNNKKIIIKNND